MTCVQFRKITEIAESRMRTRTAKEQLRDALRASEAERKNPIPTPDDGDDASVKQGWWPSSERPR